MKLIRKEFSKKDRRVTIKDVGHSLKGPAGTAVIALTPGNLTAVPGAAIGFRAGSKKAEELDDMGADDKTIVYGSGKKATIVGTRAGLGVGTGLGLAGAGLVKSLPKMIEKHGTAEDKRRLAELAKKGVFSNKRLLKGVAKSGLITAGISGAAAGLGARADARVRVKKRNRINNK